MQTFSTAPLYVEQTVLIVNRAPYSLRVLLCDVVVSVSATEWIKSPVPPSCKVYTAVSISIFHLPHSTHSHRSRCFKIFGSNTWTCHSACVEKFFGKCSARNFAPPFNHAVKQPWSGMLGRLQPGTRAVSVKLDYHYAWWVANQGGWRPPAHVFIIGFAFS